MSASFASEGLSEREALRRLLRQNGILRASEAQPIRGRNGEFAPWAFYSWNVSLTPAGARLIAANMLDRLRTFRSTQLASWGYTGLPILSACVALSEGKYTGAAIREKRKQTVACRRIDGPLDPSRPVVVIDDSISSGTSLWQAIQALEEEGIEVEGSLALVRFPAREGCEFAFRNGYRAEWLFDIWQDLEMDSGNTSPRRAFRAARGEYRIAEGLAPAVVARQAMQYYLATGYAPQPPLRLDKDYDGRGGVFVSLRERATDYRLAREGFWHFEPGEFRAGPDVVEAAVETVRRAVGRTPKGRLEDWKIGVTFFTPLERIQPRQLDFDRYGIVVRSRVPPHRCGGALPNTQVFISEIEQYRQARVNNAQLVEYEDHELFRHDITKCVEEGADWLPYGWREGLETSWWKDAAIGEQLTVYAERVVKGEPRPEFECSLPCGIGAVAVTLYDGGLRGYGLTWSTDLKQALTTAAQAAAADPRAAAIKGRPFSTVVSVLHHPEMLVHLPFFEIVRKIRRGLDSMSLTVSGRTFAILPSVIAYNNFTRGEFVETLMRQAGVSEGGEYRTWQTAAWLRRKQDVYPLRFGFPSRDCAHYDEGECESDMQLLGSYIFRNLRANGLPVYSQSPVTGEMQESGTVARVLHGLLALGLAGAALGEPQWTQAAAHGLRRALSSPTDGALADCVLLAGISLVDPTLARSDAAGRLARSLVGMLQSEGSIRRGPKRLALRHDHDYLPGAVLWAIGSYCEATGYRLPEMIGSQLAFYRRRFAATPTWGAAGWQTQGWHAVLKCGSVEGADDFIFEVADWAIERQLEKNGAFLEDLSPEEPSFNTGFLAEGIAAAWARALETGDPVRADQYEGSWKRAMSFMRRLMIREEDTFSMREPSKALGGVRCMQSRSDVRIDQVSHCLHALVEGWRCMQRADVDLNRANSSIPSSRR